MWCQISPARVLRNTENGETYYRQIEVFCMNYDDLIMSLNRNGITK